MNTAPGTFKNTVFCDVGTKGGGGILFHLYLNPTYTGATSAEFSVCLQYIFKKIG